MATVKDFRESYQELSGLASDVSRKLGFAGIAVIWIFKGSMPNNSFSLVPVLFFAAIAIVLSLALDLLQYTFGSLIWGAFWRIKEKSGFSDDQVVKASRFCNWPAIICFWGKLIFMIIAYSCLLIFLIKHITVI